LRQTIASVRVISATRMRLQDVWGVGPGGSTLFQWGRNSSKTEVSLF